MPGQQTRNTAHSQYECMAINKPVSVAYSGFFVGGIPVIDFDAAID